MAHRKLPWFLAKLAVSVALLWLVAREIDLAGLSAHFAHLRYPLTVLAVVAMILQLLVASLRWQLILRSLTFALPLRRLWRHCWIAQCFSQALPSAIGADVIRVWLIHRDGVTVRAGFVSAVLDRVLGLCGLVVVVIVAMLLPSGVSADPHARVVLWLLAAAAALGIIGALFFASLPAERFSRWRATRLAYELAAAVRGVCADRRTALAVCCAALLVHLLSLVAIWLLARALRLDVSIVVLSTTVPVALLAASVPVSIGGWGVREGVLVELLATQGVALEPALALSVLFGLSLVLASLPGGALWLGGRSRLTQAVTDVQSGCRDT